MQIPKTDSIKEVLSTTIKYKKEKSVVKKSVGASLRYKYIKKIDTLLNNCIFAPLWIQSLKLY